MLDLMRKHAYSWLTRAVVIVLIGVFAFWGVSTGMFTRIKPAATVNGHQILTKDVDQQAQRLRRRLEQIYGPEAAAALARYNVREQALEQLVDQQLVLDEANRLGLGISDAALEQMIEAQSAFQVNGHFDLAIYQTALRSENMRPSDFESEVRLEMLQQLMRQMVAQTVQISDAEMRQSYDQRNLKLAMSYVDISYKNFESNITATDKQIADFFQAHREQFREPERISFDFIRYDPDRLATKFNPSDKDIQNYYNRHRDSDLTHPEQVRARHILIAVAPDATPAQKAAAKAKADDLMKQIKAGANFAKLAKQFSDDPGTRNSGGDLGYFGQNEMVKPFADAAFKMKAGELTVVQTQFGYHVLQVEDHKLAHVETLAEARPQIIEALRHRAGTERAHQAIDQDLGQALNGKGLKELADKRGLDLVKTPLLAADERTAEITDPTLVPEAFKLNPNDVRVINGRNAQYLVRLVERKPSYLPKLAEIEPKVRAALVRQMAEAKALEQATAFLKQVKNPAGFATAAAAAKLAVHATGEFSRADGSIPGIGEFHEAVQAASLLPATPAVISRPLVLDGSAYVFEVSSRTPPTDEQWRAAEAAFKDQLFKQRQAEAWENFVQDLRARARITVRPELVGEQGSDAPM
ncbi:MAG TPA: SurA N-terminal domain-containing protein [Candidatus Binataceae bacterium]|nr:SurA N-terminal domain-containing protein [Candidatus Binataceae bacterium]